MRTSRPARLTGGGPIWDLRTPKRAADRPARTSPLPEADAAMALNDAITSAVAALGKGYVAQARAMKRRAWEYVALLHPAQTVRQRRTLGMLGRRIAQAERIGRSHQDGPAIRASSDRTQAELDATVNECHGGRLYPEDPRVSAGLPSEFTATAVGQTPASAAAAPASPFAGRPAAADDAGMAQVPGDERCKHGEIAAWCGPSECMAARKGLPARVWRTPYGSAYHRTPTCQALLEGHRMAERHGRETHPAESVPLSEAMSALLGECFHCFPENVPADAKPCQVLSGGVWVDGFLLEWQRGAGGRWKGLVNYRHEAGRRVALKDQAELRTAGCSTRL
jgi:hypothetical protein